MDDKKNVALDLLLRIQRAQEGEEVGDSKGHTRCVGFVLEGTNFLVPVTEVNAVVKSETVTPVPMTKSWVLGVTNVRSSVYTVVDLAGFAGLRIRAVRGTLPLIVLQARGFSTALRVSEVKGLKLVPDTASDNGAQEVFDGLRPWVSRSVDLGGTNAHSESERWHELDLAALTASDEFTLVAADSTAA